MNLLDFYEESTSNGTGWRSVFFFAGCPHHCKGCQNPQSWDYEAGEKFEYKKYLRIISNNPMIKGITLSGGEPLSPEKVADLIPFLLDAKAQGLNIWCYTGYTLGELYDRAETCLHTDYILNLIDVLVEGRFEEDKADSNLVFRGSSNQRIFDMGLLRATFPAGECIMRFEEEVSNDK